MGGVTPALSDNTIHLKVIWSELEGVDLITLSTREHYNLIFHVLTTLLYNYV